MKKILLITIVCSYIFVSLGSALRESLTYDENVHIQLGLDAWKTHTFTKDPYSPPLIGEIAVMPILLGIDAWIPGLMPSMKLLPSRMMILFLSLCLLAALYYMVKKIFGEPEAIASVFLFAWEPSILAHNHYVTKDMGFTLFFFLSWIFFLALCKKYSLKMLIRFSLLFGCMLAAKTSAVPFFICSTLILIFLDASYRKQIIKIGWNWVLVCVVGLFVVWSSYFFQTDVIIAKRDDPNRISSKLVEYALQTNNTVLSNMLKFGTDIKIPLGTYLASQKNGLLLQKNQESVFFMGQKYARVRWYLLPVNLFFKLPLPIIVLVGVTFFWFFKKQLPVQKYFPYIAPIVGITVFLCLSGVKPYVRYLLPIYPFLIITAAAGLTRMLKKHMLVVPMILCVWYAIGTLLHFPHFITFANESAGPRDKRYEKLIDSNINWGQELFDVAEYIKKNQLSVLSFSYFGTDNGNFYGLASTIPYGTYKQEEICAFHDIAGSPTGEKKITAISLSNWYYCGYYKQEPYNKERIQSIVAGTILIFDQFNPTYEK